MHAFTVSPKNGVVAGIACDGNHYIHIGELGRGRKLVSVLCPDESVLVPVPDGQVENRFRLMSVPCESGARAVVVLVKDYSGFRGNWLATDPSTKGAPSWKVIAEGRCAQGDAGRMGGGPEYLAILGEGQSVEIVRTGRLYGDSSRLLMRNDGGEVVVSDADADAATAAAAAKW